MGFELETDDGDKLEIDFDNKEVKGTTTKKNLQKQIDMLKKVIGD